STGADGDEAVRRAVDLGEDVGEEAFGDRGDLMEGAALLATQDDRVALRARGPSADEPDVVARRAPDAVEVALGARGHALPGCSVPVEHEAALTHGVDVVRRE